MEYDWVFGPAVISVDPTLGNIVTGINWYCVGYDSASGNNFKTSGLVAAPAADSDNFVPFDQLDSTTVSNWVFASVDQNATEAALLAESQVVPTVVPFNF